MFAGIWVAAVLSATAPSGAAPGEGGRAPGAPGAVFDRIVAVVEGQPLTLSELQFEARVQLVRLGGAAAASAPLDEAALRAALELGIAQRLEAAEAERLQAFAPDPQELARLVEDFATQFESLAALDAFLARHEADRSQLLAVLSRAVRAERFLDSKLQLRAQVTEADVRRQYDTQPALRDRPYEEVRAALRERLVRERYGQLAAIEVEELEHAASVRRVAPFARREKAP